MAADSATVCSKEISSTTQINGSTSQLVSSPNDIKCHTPEESVSSNNVYVQGSKDIFGNVNNSSLEHSASIITNTETQQQLVHHQDVVSIDENTLLNLASTDHVISDTANITSVTTSNGAIYLLVSSDSANNVLQSVESQDGVGLIAETLKNTDHNSSNSTVQIMNSEGIPVNINVSDLLSTITGSRTSTKIDSSTSQTAQNILSLSSSIISTTDSNSSHQQMTSAIDNSARNRHYLINEPLTEASSIPNWALHLRDCTLFGDTYTGYVTNETEMDAILNLYKKETQSLFAIRQTPSPAKDESSDTVRLMWKSQYVPYDGIPFVNVGTLFFLFFFTKYFYRIYVCLYVYTLPVMFRY